MMNIQAETNDTTAQQSGVDDSKETRERKKEKEHEKHNQRTIE